MRQIKNEKNIVPPVDQFRAFSVYEDKPNEVEVRRREPTFKPFVAKDSNTRKENIFVNAAGNSRKQALAEKQPERPKEAPVKRLTSNIFYIVF